MSHVECRNCGSKVTKRFARVFGDNDNNVYGCLDCSSGGQVINGAAALGDNHHGRNTAHDHARS